MRDLLAWHRRLRHVHVESLDGLRCIERYDSRKSTFFIDPPYVCSTRASSGRYAVEMTDVQHQRLIDRLLTVKGAVILCGFNSDIYRPLRKAGWQLIRRSLAIHAAAGRAKHRPRKTEYFWRNPQAVKLTNS